MRPWLIAFVLTWTFLLSRAALRPAEEPAGERFSASCVYERTDAVGGAERSTEGRSGPCFPASPREELARR